MARIIVWNRYVRLVCSLGGAALFLIALVLSSARTAQQSKAAPEAKALAAPEDPPQPPIVLPPDKEFDIETDPFAVIKAETQGKVKWLVHVDGYDKPVKTFAHPSAPILVVAVPPTGFVLVTAVTAVKDEPYSAQTRVKAKGGGARPQEVGPYMPGQRLDVNLVYDIDKMTPDLRSIADGQLGKLLEKQGHAWHHYDYRSDAANRRKLTAIVTKPGNGGVPALIIMDKEGKVLPDGKPHPVPATTEGILALVKKLAG